jgi:HCOMODA/2-hydroxy-3-carboxy-muconic semialdehyde decarboxylase
MNFGPMPPAIEPPADPAVVRNQIVVAGRVLSQVGVLDAFGHVSGRHPARPDRFFMTRRVAPGLASLEDVHEFGLDGELAEGDGVPLFGERFIHSAIYAARPDVNAVVHSHSNAMVATGLVEDRPLRAVSHMCGFLGCDTPVFEIRDVAGDATNMLIVSQTLGHALADCLGGGSVVLMRRHGSTAVGATVPHAVYRSIYAEENARIQMTAEAIGTPSYLTADEAAACEELAPFQVERSWDFWVSRLDSGS